MIRVGATKVRPTMRSPRYPPIRPTASRTRATIRTNSPMAKNIWPNLSRYDMRRHPFDGETTSRWAHLIVSDAPTGPTGRQDFGQAASILSTVSFVLWPVIQAVACFQKAFEPIAAGICSEPSNRKTAVEACSATHDSWSTGLFSRSRLSPLLALTQPPLGVALAFSFAQVSEE